MADDEERERAAATPEEPGAAPAPDLAPAEPTIVAQESPPSTSGGSSNEVPSGVRRDDNPFSFRHFLKEDRSQTAGAYERTGARPKMPKSYASTSPPSTSTSLGEASSLRRGGTGGGGGGGGGDGGYRRANAEPLGMPSLPDFVQDHILVEQAYLDSAEPIDLHNLPDFTALGGGGSQREGRVPPVELRPHLDLDLTESVYDRRCTRTRDRPTSRTRAAPSHTFPLDLPPASGSGEDAGGLSEAMPDFLPPQPGRASPAPSPAHPPHLPSDAALQRLQSQVHRLQSQLHNTRSELCEERARVVRLERELGRERAAADTLRAQQRHCPASPTAGCEEDSNVASLLAEIRRLKEALEEARARQASAARDLRASTGAADASLRELLAGLDRLRSISSALEPP